MTQTDFQRVKACNQRDKDIVYGYIRKVQSILPHEQNSYFIIVQLIQNLILLYFHNKIDSKLLTHDEQSKLFKLFEDNAKDKFMKLLRNKSLKLIFKSSGKDMNAKNCIEKVYDRKDILILIHSENDNICGGYTSVGWSKELQNGAGDRYVPDKDAFIFNIRSSNGYEPKLSYSQDWAQKALRHYTNDNAYLMFGNLDLYIWKASWDREVLVFANGSICYYDSFPKEHYFLGQYSDTLKAIEIFQFD